MNKHAEDRKSYVKILVDNYEERWHLTDFTRYAFRGFKSLQIDEAEKLAALIMLEDPRGWGSDAIGEGAIGNTVELSDMLSHCILGNGELTHKELIEKIFGSAVNFLEDRINSLLKSEYDFRYPEKLDIAELVLDSRNRARDMQLQLRGAI
jgi:hypothetical protein